MAQAQVKGAISCVGKRVYSDFVTARKMAKRTNNDRDDAHVAPYRCKICTHWHLGARAQPVVRRPRPELEA